MGKGGIMQREKKVVQAEILKIKFRGRETII